VTIGVIEEMGVSPLVTLCGGKEENVYFFTGRRGEKKAVPGTSILRQVGYKERPKLVRGKSRYLAPSRDSSERKP